MIDAKSSQIIRHEVVPRFRTGDFSGGVVAGTQAILTAIEGTYINSNPALNTSTPQLGLWEAFGLAVAIGTFIGLFLVAGRRINGSIIGGIIAFLVGIPVAFWVAVFSSSAALFLVSLYTHNGGPPSRNPFAHDSGLG